MCRLGVVSVAGPDEFEVVRRLFGFADEAVGSEGEPWVDFAAKRFDGLHGPDVADAGDEVGVSGLQLHTVSPTGLADYDRASISAGPTALVEKVREGGVIVAFGEFSPDPMVGAGVDDIPADGDQFHDRPGRSEEHAEDFPIGVHSRFRVGILVSPAQGDEFRVSKVLGWNVSGFQQPVIWKDHAGVIAVRDQPDENVRILRQSFGRGLGPDGRAQRGRGWFRSNREADATGT